MKEETVEEESLHHQQIEVRVSQPLGRVGPELGPSLGPQIHVRGQGLAQVVLVRGHVVVADLEGHQDHDPGLEGQALEIVEGQDPLEEGHDQDPVPEIWTETVFTWQILTATPPNVTWRKLSQSLGHWLRFGWQEVFPALLLLSTRTKKMPTKPAGQLMVKMCVEEEFVWLWQDRELEVEDAEVLTPAWGVISAENEAILVEIVRIQSMVTNDLQVPGSAADPEDAVEDMGEDAADLVTEDTEADPEEEDTKSNKHENGGL